MIWVIISVPSLTGSVFISRGRDNQRMDGMLPVVFSSILSYYHVSIWCLTRYLIWEIYDLRITIKRRCGVLGLSYRYLFSPIASCSRSYGRF